MTATHPTDRELNEFLLGKLDEPDDGAVESHLAGCDTCRDRALATPADDTLTDLLTAARFRVDVQRSIAPTPTLDGSSTPPAFAPTLTWDGPAASAGEAAPPPALATHPKYRVLRRLGTGGMGTVWLAEHQVMHRPVAVKVIRPDLLARPGATGRFLREVRAAARLHHPNIVTAFDAEPVGDSCLLVMEYVPGQTLAERLDAGPLPVAEALRAVRDAARGLAHAHAHGLVHRDVKPHNLIRAADGTTKVLDFGLAGVGAGEGVAAAGDGLTGAGMVVGTPDYIAPEQIADPHAADARADIYGLGCTLYHLLAGRPPLPDGTVAEKLAAQPTYQPDPIPNLPPGLAAVLAKMMAKRPEDRYRTADELVAALERCLRLVDPARRRRRRLLAIAAGVVFAGLLVAAGVVIKIERDNQVIEVRTDDPDIEVVMKRKGEVLRIIDQKSGQTWEIDTLRNEIAQADTPDGLTLALPDKEAIVLKRNGKDVFTVARVAKPAPAVARHDFTPPPAPRLVRTIEGGRRFPQTPAFTPDGKALLVAGFDYFAMYDPATGKELFSDKYNSASVNTPLAVSADGRTAAVACADLIVYDLAARKRATTYPRWEDQGKIIPATALSLSADGQTLAAVVGQGMWYYDRDVGRIVFPPLDDGGRVLSARYSPDGKYLALAARVEADQSTRISLLDATTRQLVGRHETTFRSGATLQFSQDGRQLFVAGTDILRRTFLVLGVPSVKEVEPDPDLPSGPEAPVPSPDGHLLALTGADGTVQVWDRGQKRVTFSWNPHPQTPPEFRPPPGRKAGPPRTGIAFSPDGRNLATARGDQVRVWDLTPDPQVPQPKAAPRGEIEKLQGTWTSMSPGGVQTQVTIRGTHFALRRIPKWSDPRAKEPSPELLGDMLDETTSDPPARFRIEDSKVSTPLQGIYRIEGDTLFLCLRKHEKGREYPTTFATNPETGDELFVLKRAASRPDRNRILGTWRGVDAEVNGESLPEEFIDLMKPTLTFTADKLVGKPQGTVPKAFLNFSVSKGLLPKEAIEVAETGVEGVYHLDPAKAPKEIDFTILGAVRKTALGIYQLDGDTLKLCLSIDPARVSERPKELASKAGEKRVVLTLRRMTPEEIVLEDVERRIDPANADGKNLPFALLERKGVAALRFGKWRLVFEGVPCDSRGKVLFGVGAFFLPETGGRGSFVDPGLKRPTPPLRQQSTGRGNVIAIERYEFQLETKGTRLVFGDKTYEATDKVQTIVIAPDGTTRLDPPPMK